MTVPDPISSHLLAQCLGSPQALAELQWLCDNVGGRTSGAESGRRGEEWAYGLFNQWGLEGRHFEEFAVTVWERGELDAQVTRPVSWRLTTLSHGNCPPIPSLTLDVVP